jgi:hypothetical protein
MIQPAGARGVRSCSPTINHRVIDGMQHQVICSVEKLTGRLALALGVRLLDRSGQVLYTINLYRTESLLVCSTESSTHLALAGLPSPSAFLTDLARDWTALDDPAEAPTAAAGVVEASPPARCSEEEEEEEEEEDDDDAEAASPLTDVLALGASGLALGALEPGGLGLEGPKGEGEQGRAVMDHPSPRVLPRLLECSPRSFGIHHQR